MAFRRRAARQPDQRHPSGQNGTSLGASDLPRGMQVAQALRPLTPLLAAAAFAVTAMTLVGSLLVA